MRKRLNRLSALLLAAWLLAVPVLPALAAEGDTVTISTAEDLQRFGKNCALDTWSRGKTVVLAADLDLAGEEFTPIPTFGGVFEGGGHTISGVRITGPGSTQGLFRYVQPGAEVRDLTVKGTVSPGGTRSTVGGIVGDNAGVLWGCSFQGAVQGKSTVGGVAGRNSVTGELVGCSASGSVSGENATGGIVGRNLGLLLQCTNSAGVNLTQTESDIDLTDAGAAAALEERAAADDEAYHLLEGCTDTGGVAGYSSGVIQSCVNNGPVGYPHVGYNTGGVAGRQSGYMAGCVNNGMVHGRKDVGGVVGQAEPYFVVDPGRDTLEQLRTELDTLDRLINRALDDAQRTGDDVSARLEAMGNHTDAARESSQRLLNRVSDFTDENVNTVNTLTADITHALEKISPALDDLSGVGRRLERLSRQLDDALDSLGGAVDTGDRMMDDLQSAVGGLRQSSTGLIDAVNRMEQALKAFRRFLDPGSGGISWSELSAARTELSQAFNALRGAGDSLDGALAQLERALSRSGALSGQLGDALEELQDATTTSASIGRLLRRAFDTIGDGVDILTGNGPAEFSPLGEEARQASDSLFDALAGLSGEMEELSGELQRGGDALNADLRAISRQFNVIFDILFDAINDLRDTVDEGLDGVVQDTSEEDIAATREGKVDSCSNIGVVEGDRNVGGVVGAMAMELDLDPEDDTADRLSFGSSYETKAVLVNCLNRGAVTAKKDCVGGLAGRMDLGTALDCQNYSPVTSTSGDYVGGVAGWADASIRGCCAKSTLSGGSYVGGIAGWASRLRDSRAIATIQAGEECLGAIAGGIEVDGGLSGNLFVDTGVAGVDGVSYAGRAEPIPFVQLEQLEDVPPEFTAFTLTLTAEGETVAQIPFLYGDDLSRIALPEVPEQEGCYGLWPEFDCSGSKSDLTVEAVYTPWVTLVASEETAGKLALALAEGQFTEEAVLHIQPAALSSTVQTEGEQWDVTLTGTDLEQEEEVTLRLLNTTGGRAEVRQYQRGQWVSLDTETNGSYLVVTMRGPCGTFHIVPAQSAPWLIPTAVGGVIVLAALVLVVSKRQQAKKAVKAPEEQEETAKK